MAYVLEAVIAATPLAHEISAALPVGRAVERPGGFAVVPLFTELVTAMSDGRRHDAPLLVSQPVPRWLADLLRDASAAGPIAYVEAEFFGGEGMQASIVWEQGEIVLGPLVDPPNPLEDPPPGAPRTPLLEMPINRALRRIGVEHAPDRSDEFASLGLGRHRFTDEWGRLDDGA